MIQVTIKFAGDSGDGIQLTGARFSETAALTGSEVITLPLFPAEIRAPAGSLYGVSEFQARVSENKLHTPGSIVDVLIAFNPAALKVNAHLVKPQGLVLVNSDAFDELSLKKAGYQANPLENGSLGHLKVIKVPLLSLTKKALADFRLNQKDLAKCKNFFALGLLYRMFDHPLKPTHDWLAHQFKDKPILASANQTALRVGGDFSDIHELQPGHLVIGQSSLTKDPGDYRFINGNTAFAMAIAAVPQLSGRQVCFAGYPITPASSILFELMQVSQLPLITFQAEDEMAAAGAALGASYAGGIGITATSGPGFSLKSEVINLAVMAELPLIVIDVQRAGPSTGMPTKTEQSDLLQALWGRHGESPVVVLAPKSPKDCFDTLLEATKLSIQHMMPVIILSDGFLAHSSESWRVPDIDFLPRIEKTEVTSLRPYQRNEDSLGRPWISPGSKGQAHMIGGLEKSVASGQISYAAEDHAQMVQIRSQKLARVAASLPPLQIEGYKTAAYLVISWGSSYGAVCEAMECCQMRGLSLAHLHLRALNPFPEDLAKVLRNYTLVMVCENNSGQLCLKLRAEFLIDAKPVTQINGQPWSSEDLCNAFLHHIK